MSKLDTDLSMATISLAKVVDINKVIEEAKVALQNKSLNEDYHKRVKSVLEQIEDKEDYELTPDFIEEIDSEINDIGNVVVGSDGEIKTKVEGTENFGFSLKPKDWRADRVASCESLLDDIYGNIKKWVNTLGDKLNEIFSNNQYAIDSLKERLEEASKHLSVVADKPITNEFVIVSKDINRRLWTDKGSIITNVDFINKLDDEIKFILMIIKVWGLDCTERKNKILKFFGNKGKDISLLQWKHPKIFNKYYIDPDEGSNYQYWYPNRRLMGIGTINFREYKGPSSTLEESLPISALGYEVYDEYNLKEVKELGVKAWDTNTLDDLYAVIKTVIDVLEVLNNEDNDFNFDKKDLKDVMNTVNQTNDELLIKSFLSFTSDFQSSVLSNQSKFVKNLSILASHLITLMFMHMECREYD